MNILFIFTDQQNRYALSCMGNPNIETPNLDKLAQKGVLFRRCYSNDPVCGPFRGSLLTGQYTSTCGVLTNNLPLPYGTKTFADALNEAGYDTSWVGKWHLGGNGNEPIALKDQGGFNHYIGYQCYNGFYDDVCFYDKEGNEHKFDKHRTEVTTDLAIEQLRKLSKGDKPFMLMMSYQAPHYPEQPAPEYEAMYKDRKIIRRQNCQDIDPFTPTYSPYSPRPFEEDMNFRKYGNDLDEYIRLYNAMCTQIDADTGRLLDELEALGIAEDTMVVFTSDHGDMQGSHGLKNKCLPYEESAGIPFIAYVPGTPGGRISDALVSGIDMMPTCLELAGAQIPDSVQGQSFASLLKGETTQSQDTIFVENNQTNWCMILKGDWKLAAERQDDGLAPYLMTNLREDPYEKHNRFEDASVAELRKELLSELNTWNSAIKS
jgi:arylsulfatase A-like enzyme